MPLIDHVGAARIKRSFGKGMRGQIILMRPLCLLFQGKACNVGKAAEVRDLANFALSELGRVDIW